MLINNVTWRRAGGAALPITHHVAREIGLGIRAPTQHSIVTKLTCQDCDILRGLRCLSQSAYRCGIDASDICTILIVDELGQIPILFAILHSYVLMLPVIVFLYLAEPDGSESPFVEGG